MSTKTYEELTDERAKALTAEMARESPKRAGEGEHEYVKRVVLPFWRRHGLLPGFDLGANAAPRIARFELN